MGSIMITSVFACNIVQVVVRKMGGSISWVDEYARYSVLVLIIYGAALSARRGSGLRVTVVVNLIPLKLRRWADILQYSVVLAFMLWFNYSMYLGILNLGNQTLSVMTHIKVSWVYWILFAGLVLMNLYYLLFIIGLTDPQNPRYIKEDSAP